MIRVATKDDIPVLIAMGREFHAESPRYRDIPFIAEHAEIFLNGVFESTTSRIFLAENGRLDGMMGGDLQVFPMFNHDRLFSIDFGFYVRPEMRGTRCAVKLIRAYETWAIESGVSRDNVCIAESAGVSSEEVHEFLKKMGYTLNGASFRKAD